MRTVTDFPRNEAGLVDKFIGTAYDVVKKVYDNLGEIQYIYDFLNIYGVLLTVTSTDKLKALDVNFAKFARVYSTLEKESYSYIDYLFVENNLNGIAPNVPSVSGSWIEISKSDSQGNGGGSFIPYLYNKGLAVGGEKEIIVPKGTIGVTEIFINGIREHLGIGFNFNVSKLIVSLTETLKANDEVVLMLSGFPAIPDNPNISNWVMFNWLYNGGSAVGGENYVSIPFTFQAVPSIYKNGLRYYQGLSDKSYVVDFINQRILLTEVLIKGDRLIIQLGGNSVTVIMSDRTIQEVARATNERDSAVILSGDRVNSLKGKKIIYDEVTQKYWGIPLDLAEDNTISSINNGELIYLPGLIKVSLKSLDVDHLLRDDLNSNSPLKGDYLIAVKQPFNGAVTRTQHDKNKDFATFEDFGAKGDGVTDDTLAIQYAIDSEFRKITANASNPILGIKKTYRITNSLQINKENKVIDFQKSELLLDTFIALNGHIVIGDGVKQVVGVEICNAVFISSRAGESSAIAFNYAALCNVTGCRIYGDSRINRGITINRGIIISILRNLIQDTILENIFIQGTGLNENSTTDTVVYDNRLEGGTNAFLASNYVEGIFFRRNICYNQKNTSLSISPYLMISRSSKIQDNDFDTYGTSGSGRGVYLNKFSNTQITGNWFSSNSKDSTIFVGPDCDSIIISDNQLYPKSYGIEDGGIGTSIIGNMIMGGTYGVLTGRNADYTIIASNNIRNQTSSNIFAVNHTKKLHVVSNSLSGSPSAIAEGLSLELIIEGNSGDKGRGHGSSITMGASPYTYSAGPRPESVSIMGGTVSSINVDGVQIAVTSNQIFTLPPHKKAVITYSGPIPGLSVIEL